MIAEFQDMKSIFDYLSRFFQNTQKTAGHSDFNRRSAVFEKRENFKFLRHGKHICCPSHNTNG